MVSRSSCKSLKSSTLIRTGSSSLLGLGVSIERDGVGEGVW